MSRREVRESDSKRYRSRFDREPSPKRSRRDRKTVEEKLSRNSNSHVEDNKDRDQTHELRRVGQDMIPHESSLALDSKPEGGVGKGANRNSDGRDGSNKHSVNPTEVPRSRSYFQHDERGNAGQAGRSFGRSATSERGWWKESTSKDPDKNNDGASGKTTANNSQQRDEKAQAAREDRHHDGSSKLELDGLAPSRKRPAFREKKIKVEDENVEKAATVSESKKLSDPRQPQEARERREERSRDTRYSEKPNKHVNGDIATKRDEMKRGTYPARERYGNGGDGGGNYRGRDRFGGRPGFRTSGTRVEKWKHDLFHEANRSPTPKNEEDQIAKVEALLSS